MTAFTNQKSAQALSQSALGNGQLKLNKLFSVEGWVCVVTGGGTGLGLVTAAALAENGARVYITGRRLEPLEAAVKEASPKEGPGELIPIQADAGSKEGVAKMREAIEAKEKYLNCLIINHGVSQGCPDINAPEQTPEALAKYMFENETFDRWLDTYRINCASYYFTAWGFLPLLAAAKTVGGAPEPGNILTVSSMSGITVTSQRGQFNYNASKAGTISLTEQLATEFARRGFGIRVNTVAPGYFPSGMTVINPEDNAGSQEQFDTFKNKWGIPFGRPGNAIDYAQCIFGLIQNQYTTGATVVIDGGWLLKQDF